MLEHIVTRNFKRLKKEGLHPPMLRLCPGLRTLRDRIAMLVKQGGGEF
jgi:hypothetical protein